MWKLSWTIKIFWSPTNSVGKIFVFYTRFIICKYIHQFVVGFVSTEFVLIKKSQKCLLWVKSVLKLELWKIKSQYFAKLLIRLKHDMRSCVLPFLETSNHNWLTGNFSPNIWTHRWSSNSEEKKVFLPLQPVFQCAQNNCYILWCTHIYLKYIQSYFVCEQ